MTNIPDFSPSLFIGQNTSDTISFGSGQPDLPPPREVYDILETYRNFKYGPVQGQPYLREALAKQYPESTQENFVVTNGASEALDLTLRAISRKDMKQSGNLLLPRPYYYSYPYMAKYAGLGTIFTNLVDGQINIDDFEEKAHDCRVVMINSPSNPTGRVESMKTLREIEKITQDLGLYVISDEVYKDLIYTRENYLIKGPNVITINSFSKTFSMCGVRVGFLWSRNQELVDEVIEMKTHTSMNTSIVGQEMAFAATKVPQKFVEDQLKIWNDRRDMLYDGLVDLGFDLWKPEGAFYVFPKVKNSNKFVWELYQKHKVITYCGEWFGDLDRVRFSYALDQDKIEKGLGIIKDFEW